MALNVDFKEYLLRASKALKMDLLKAIFFKALDVDLLKTIFSRTFKALNVAFFKNFRGSECVCF